MSSAWSEGQPGAGRRRDPIFAQPDAEHVHEEFEVIAVRLSEQLPKAEQMLREAKEDLLGHELLTLA